MTAQNDLLADVETRLANGERMDVISADLRLGIVESMYLRDGKSLTSVTPN